MKKNQPAFTIVEVLLAMFILASSVFVLSDLQMRSLFRVISDRGQIERIFLVKNDLYGVYMNPRKATKKFVHKVELPDVIITTEVADIAKKSALNSMKKRVQIVQSQGEWKSAKGIKQLKMIGLVLKPEEEKKS